MKCISSPSMCLSSDHLAFHRRGKHQGQVSLKLERNVTHAISGIANQIFLSYILLEKIQGQAQWIHITICSTDQYLFPAEGLRGLSSFPCRHECPPGCRSVWEFYEETEIWSKWMSHHSAMIGNSENIFIQWNLCWSNVVILQFF